MENQNSESTSSQVPIIPQNSEIPLTLKLHGPIKLLKDTFKIYKDNFAILSALSFPIGLLGVFQYYVDTALDKVPFFIVQFIQNPLIVIIVLLPLSLVAQISMVMLLEKNNPKEIFKIEYFSKLIPYLGVLLLMMLSVVGGYFIFFIPGIIFWIWFYFAPFICIAENTGVLESLSKSKAYVKGRWWAVFGRVLFSYLLIPLLLGLGTGLILQFMKSIEPLIIFVSSLFTYTILFIYNYLLYRNLKAVHN